MSRHRVTRRYAYRLIDKLVAICQRYSTSSSLNLRSAGMFSNVQLPSSIFPNVQPLRHNKIPMISLVCPSLKENSSIKAAQQRQHGPTMAEHSAAAEIDQVNSRTIDPYLANRYYGLLYRCYRALIQQKRSLGVLNKRCSMAGANRTSPSYITTILPSLDGSGSSEDSNINIIILSND